MIDVTGDAARSQPQRAHAVLYTVGTSCPTSHGGPTTATGHACRRPSTAAGSLRCSQRRAAWASSSPSSMGLSSSSARTPRSPLSDPPRPAAGTASRPAGIVRISPSRWSSGGRISCSLVLAASSLMFERARSTCPPHFNPVHGRLAHSLGLPCMPPPSLPRRHKPADASVEERLQQL